MSNVETRKLYVGEHVKAECQLDGKALSRPIYFKWFWNGSYISVEQAERLAAELAAAAAAARAAVAPEAVTKT